MKFMKTTRQHTGPKLRHDKKVDREGRCMDHIPLDLPTAHPPTTLPTTRHSKRKTMTLRPALLHPTARSVLGLQRSISDGKLQLISMDPYLTPKGGNMTKK